MNSLIRQSALTELGFEKLKRYAKAPEAAKSALMAQCDSYCAARRLPPRTADVVIGLAATMGHSKPIGRMLQNLALKAVLLCAFLFAFNASAVLDFSQGIWIDGSTNSVPIGASNITRSVVLTISTNFFNMGFPIQTQPNTNAWPSQPLSSVYGCNERFVFLSGSVVGNFAGTNGVEVLVVAGSAYATPTTNGFGSAITNLWRIPINYFGTTNTTWGTNIDTLGMPFLYVQQIENTNNIVLTNSFNPPVSKRHE